MNKYWKKRLTQIANNEFDKADKVLKELKTVYNKALKQIEEDITDLYFRVMDEGEVSPLVQYQYERQIQLQQQIIAELKAIGADEVKTLRVSLFEAYLETAVATNQVLGQTLDTVLLDSMVKKAVEQGWLGSNFSARIWANKKKLLERLDKMIVDALALGKSKDQTIKDIMSALGTGFSDTDRLVRTELNYIINQAQKDMYMERGYREYEYLAEIDKRTSTICKTLNRETFLFSEAVVGTNYPPLHPRCRSTVIPVVK